MLVKTPMAMNSGMCKENVDDMKDINDDHIVEGEGKDFIEQNIVEGKGNHATEQHIFEGEGNDSIEQNIVEGEGKDSVKQNIVEDTSKDTAKQNIVAGAMDQMLRRQELRFGSNIDVLSYSWGEVDQCCGRNSDSHRSKD